MTTDYAPIDRYVEDQMSDAHIRGLALTIAAGHPRAPWIGNLLTTDVGQWLFTTAILLLLCGLVRLVLAAHRQLVRRGPFPRHDQLQEASAS